MFTTLPSPPTPLPLTPQCVHDALASEGHRLTFVPRQGGELAEAMLPSSRI